MIKLIVRKYLNKKLAYLNYQILSLETELGYADNISEEDEKNMLIKLVEYRETIGNIIYVIERVL